MGPNKIDRPDVENGGQHPPPPPPPQKKKKKRKEKKVLSNDDLVYRHIFASLDLNGLIQFGRVGIDRVTVPIIPYFHCMASGTIFP